MGDNQKTGRKRIASSANSRPTIGLLIGRLGGLGYASNVWPGVADVAEERDVNLVCFVGGALRALHEFDAQRNVTYDLAGPENVDGLVSMSGSIGQFIGPKKLSHFYERYQSLPMVSIAMPLDGTPCVLVDNKIGMRSAITHLIEVHGLRRIAFIRGPETNTEAEQRYHTYAEVLVEHGIPLDPDLVAPGNYLSPAGAEAIRLFFDQRKVGLEAVASANDEMALGALAALRKRGVRVPDDLCVVGFDDLDEGRYANPPLTTIRQPLYEQGRRATEMLLSLLSGEDVPERLTLPTELVIRRSCGCLHLPALVEANELVTGANETFKIPYAARRKHILTEIKEAAGTSARTPNPVWAKQLLDAFLAMLRDQSKDAFLSTLDETLRQVGAEGGDVMRWDRVLSVLRRHALPPLTDDETLSRDENLWQQAHVLIGETAQWAQAYRRMQAERRAFDFSINVSEPLMTAFDINGLTNVVAQQLPRMGIRSCYISLYEKPSEENPAIPTEQSRLILAYNEKGRIELEPGGRCFSSRNLVPDGILSRVKRYAVMLEPLYFRDETQLGFIIFEPLHSEAGVLREALSRQISTALKGALLLQERKQIEEKLRESESLYRSIINTSPDDITIADMQGIIRFVSPAGARMLGYKTTQEMIGKSAMDYVTPQEHERITALLQDASRGVPLKTAEYRAVKKDGSLFDAEANIELIRDSEGQPSGIMAVIRDITERKQAQEALRESEELYRTLVRASPNAVTVTDLEGNITYVSPQTLKRHGYESVEELLGKSAFTFIAQEEHDKAMANLQKTLQGEVVRDVEYTLLRKNGERFIGELSAAVIRDAGGHPKAFIATTRDISRRKRTEEKIRESEERYRSLAEASHDMIFIVDRGGQLKYVNSFAAHQFQKPVEEIIGTSQIDLFPPEVARRQAENLRIVLDTEKPLYVEGPSFFLGKQTWLGTWLVPLKDEQGRVENVMGVARDINERRQAQETLKEYSERLEAIVEERTKELQEALQKAQMADHLKSEFVANVNHELRTPLTNLVLYYQMMSINPAVKTQERLDVVGRELQRLRNLIEDLLNLSRLDLGQVAFNPRPHNLNELIRSLVNDRRALAEEHGLTLTAELLPELPLVRMDDVMIVQAVSNLLTNALNYTPAGGQVLIRTKMVDDQSGKPGVVFSVQDTGPGINKKDLPHIFKRFYRGRAGHETGAPGTGLGLSIVSEIVERHHGRIEVNNVGDDDGAVFSVWLPL